MILSDRAEARRLLVNMEEARRCETKILEVQIADTSPADKHLRGVLRGVQEAAAQEREFILQAMADLMR
jgi:hypothetical protein